MFEDGEMVATAQLTRLVGALPRLASSVDDAERIDKIRALEELKSAAAATQAQLTADFADSEETTQAAAGVASRDVGRGIAGQVGLAKRESPHRARRYIGWARILVTELPHTYAALQRGETSEWQAMIVGRETGWLSGEHRALVDAQLAGRLEAMGDRAVEAETKKLAYRLDPHGAAARSARAAADRRVTVRPAPDTMSRLTGFLPVAQGVAAYAALQTHADTLIGAGDTRSRGQIMADTLVERITGQATADAVPLEVNLVMTDQALLRTNNDTGYPVNDADEPAHLHGHGPIPAPLARRLLNNEDAQVWLRRVYTHPNTGQLVAMDSQRRLFEHGLRKFLVLRDQYCRTPWCGAPIRHADHPTPAEDGGETSADNGQGLCEACNYTKQALDWSAEPGPRGAGHSVVTTTPTGHTYTSRPPDPPGRSPRDRPAANPLSGTAPPARRGLADTRSAMEARLRALIDAA